MKDKFSGIASRLSWELFKRTGQINYYLLYRHIEDSPNPTAQDFLEQQKDDGVER